MKLYYSPGACSLAPHILLREIGEPFDLVEIHTAKGMHRTEAYLRINPRGRVPALETDGCVITEAPAILTALALRYPHAALVPQVGSIDAARCFEWLSWFATSLHGAYLQLWRPERHVDEGSTELLKDFAVRAIRRMNQEVEQRLVGPWLLGDAYSIADIYALVFFGWGGRLGSDLEHDCPKWYDWASRAVDRRAVRDAIVHEQIQAWFPPC